MRIPTRLVAAAAVVVLSVAACATDDTDPAPDATATQEAAPDGPEGEAPDLPEPDLAGLPDVVAEVNGVDISLADFTAAYEGRFQQEALQAQMSGQPLDQDALKVQTADVLVDTELLLQEADAREITASDADVETTLTDLAAAYGFESPEEALAAFEEQGMAEAEVREQLTAQVRLDLLYAEEGGDYTPDEEELQQRYDDALAQQPPAGEGEEGGMPPFEEVRPQLEEQLTQEHQAEAITTLLEQLRQDADIIVHL